MGNVGNVFVVVCLTVAIPVDRRICCPCRCCNLQRPANTLRGCCTFVVLSCFCVVLGCCPILGNLEVVVVSGGGWVSAMDKQNKTATANQWCVPLGVQIVINKLVVSVGALFTNALACASNVVSASVKDNF